MYVRNKKCTGMAYFKLLSQNLPCKAEEHHKKPSQDSP